MANPTKIVRQLVAPALFLALVTLATGCDRARVTEPVAVDTTPTTISIGTMGDAVDYAPYMIARDKGWFEEAFAVFGVEDVTYTSFQSLGALNQSIASGQTNIIFEAGPPAIIGRAGGNDIRVVGISCTLVQEIVVRADSEIRSVSDLRGKKIAVPAGTSSHYNLLKIVRESGLSGDDIEVLDMSPPDGREAFTAARVDGWAIWPPYVEEQVVSGTGRALTGTNANINSIMSVTGDLQDSHPDIARAAFDVLQRSKTWIQENPEEAQSIVARTLDLEPQVVKLAWPKHNWAAELDDQITQDFQEKADFLKEQGVLRSELDVKQNLLFPYERR